MLLGLPNILFVFFTLEQAQSPKQENLLIYSHNRQILPLVPCHFGLFVQQGLCLVSPNVYSGDKSSDALVSLDFSAVVYFDSWL